MNIIERTKMYAVPEDGVIVADETIFSRILSSTLFDAQLDNYPSSREPLFTPED
jgi:hypothetical protein